MEPAYALEEVPRRRPRIAALDVIPVGVIIGVGALTIAFWTDGGNRGSHVYWLSAVLAENAVALFWRRRHPLFVLAAVTAAYVVFDALALAVLPLFLALATVTASAGRRVAFAAAATASLVVVAVPAFHGDRLDGYHVLLPLSALGLAVIAGALLSGRHDGCRRSSGSDEAVRRRHGRARARSRRLADRHPRRLTG